VILRGGSESERGGKSGSGGGSSGQSTQR